MEEESGWQGRGLQALGGLQELLAEPRGERPREAPQVSSPASLGGGALVTITHAQEEGGRASW